MMRILRSLPLVAGAMLALSAPLASARGQVSERPAPFDTAGKVLSLTAPIAARLALGPPAWPVTGAFVEARLFELGNGRYVISVQRIEGTVDRYEISAEQRDALQRAVTAGIASTGSIVARERQDTEFEPASSAFVRNQTILGLLVYGPAAAALVDGGAGAGALYLATAGTTFFTSLAISRSQTVTKAQNRLATDGGWRGALIGLGTKYAIGGDDDEGSANAAVILAGGLIGSAIGFNAGRTLTTSEATAATFGSTFATLTTAGIIGAAGGFQDSESSDPSPGSGVDDDDENRGEIAGLVAAAIAGYPLGLAYARRASYGVTAGDIGPLATAGVIGAIGASAFLDDGAGDQTGAAVVTAGYVLGTLIGDRAFVRPYDLTEGEGRLIGLGATAGGLVAIAIPTLAESSDDRVYNMLGALGAAAGMWITTSLLKPERVDRRTSSGDGASSQSARSTPRVPRRPTLILHPQNASLLFSRSASPRTIPLASLQF